VFVAFHSRGFEFASYFIWFRLAGTWATSGARFFFCISDSVRRIKLSFLSSRFPGLILPHGAVGMAFLGRHDMEDGLGKKLAEWIHGGDGRVVARPFLYADNLLPFPSSLLFFFFFPLMACLAPLTCGHGDYSVLSLLEAWWGCPRSLCCLPMIGLCNV